MGNESRASLLVLRLALGLALLHQVTTLRCLLNILTGEPFSDDMSSCFFFFYFFLSIVLVADIFSCNL